ncbi:hypothetical protein Pst134EA_003120 [Puccinia striiformis f. sp. tritici]|uniref:Peptidase M50 domain-containing protein n=1 Tax=Puccinia striiformis f. sp. tritici PST-78 TaxID=1165861 RepID=A0A0L0W4S6_9BASI|nr:hypothetical protein Pst134EA_003120 [Puccinia striiformis f. sp. tritici]KAH9464654.1 hypothetical protein Pst134EB_004176 [Puccinia striiformis f. sp. tritici]KAH9472510.1 hypothetical protein Pst134EA_003120 [Puccinia striiformis f. sp. tritici]KAI9626192.1 hypothetical protein H4Q26_015942 [Puccinia striiformis f. sp. tritici PST-130]KNF06533.1 hypothetical protein PSTG_00407 [Puccinia striiformis f. sp. tritici PST-78]
MTYRIPWVLLLLISRLASSHHLPSVSSTAQLPANTALSRQPPPPLQAYDDVPAALPSQPATVNHQQLILQKRAPNWTTVTIFVNTVTAYADAPKIVTVTVNAADQTPKTGTATVTVGGYTQTLVQQGSPQSTSTHTVFIGASSTIPPTPQATQSPKITTTNTTDNSNLKPDRHCGPDEANQKYPGILSLTRPTQTTTLLVMALYLLVILVCWNLFLIRFLLFPLKLVIISWHELGHVIVSIFVGRTIEEVQIDPNVGGSVVLHDEIIPPAAPLFAGYLSSCLLGGLMVFCGFDTLASKIASIFIAMSLLGVMWWAISITSKILTVAALGVLVGFWFIDHAGMLRYYVLLMGVLSCWYVLFDVMDDFIFRKLNPCCPILFEQRWPRITAPQWTMIWILYSGINFTAWVLLAIAIWRQTPRGMFCQSQQFLPT